MYILLQLQSISYISSKFSLQNKNFVVNTLEVYLHLSKSNYVCSLICNCELHIIKIILFNKIRLLNKETPKLFTFLFLRLHTTSAFTYTALFFWLVVSFSSFCDIIKSVPPACIYVIIV